MDENIPYLTLEPALDEAPAPAVPEEKELQAAGPDLSALSEAEREAVRSFAEKIDITNSRQVLQYGAAAQKDVSDFSDSALKAVRTKDMGEIGEMVGSLLKELKGFSSEEEEPKKGVFGLFRKAGRSIEDMKIKYQKAEGNVDKIAGELEKHQLTLMKDVAVMDQMYQKNLNYYKQLTMYILAGQEKLAHERNVTLPELQRKARQTGAPEDAQAASDYQDLCLRFEKKLHDLDLTRMVSLQMGPQIRMLQNNDTLMTEKIQTTIVNTIPLWKSQMVLALGTHHAQQAVEAERAVTDMTNELLKKNADALKMATVETARASERSVVDIETLQHTNQTLISTLDEVLQIQNEGAQKRREAEAELRRIEDELKRKLLEVRR